MIDPLHIKRVRRTVWSHYRKNGRHDLPWRATSDPYCILVSEIMLQQTPVARVIEKYHAFLLRFPTVSALACAQRRAVIVAWQGLGYNRRAKMLHDASRMIIDRYGGSMPQTYEELQTLPGVGPYTAGAVAVFAHNVCVPIIETNIRTVIMHHFFHERTNVPDRDIREALTLLSSPRTDPRRWYWALMDYGAGLKQSGVRTNSRSKHYKVQTRFEGSDREVRGAILRVLAQGEKACTAPALVRQTGMEKERILAQLKRLEAEGMLVQIGSRYTL